MAKLIHPYEDLEDGRWLKGMLHLHTELDVDPGGVHGRPMKDNIRDYFDRGYRFLMFTQFNGYKNQAQLNQERASAQRYPNEFRDLILLPGFELEADHATHPERTNPHFLTGPLNNVAPADLDSLHILGNYPEMVRKARGDEALIILVHPNLGQYRINPDDLRHLKDDGLTGMEVLTFSNEQAPALETRLQGNWGNQNYWPAGPDIKWDHILVTGRSFWGFGSDDTFAAEDIGRFWNIAYVYGRPTTASVVDALQKGRFYVRTGVSGLDNSETEEAENAILAITEIEVDDMEITLKTRGITRCFAVLDSKYVDEPVPSHGQAGGLTFTYPVPKDATYVRFECLSDHSKRAALTQPFFVRH